MLTVAQVFPEIQRVLGICDTEETYSKINEGIKELSNLGNWDPNVMFMDICTSGCEVTLPDDVEVPLAVNVGGRPAEFRNKWFEFHLNGPGSECCTGGCSFAWQDKGDFPTFRDPVKASSLAAYPEDNEAPGAALRVYGYYKGEWIMTPDCFGVLQDGFDVPIIFGMGSGIPTTQLVDRITRVSKPVTNGFVKLVALDPGSCHGATLLGDYRPYITEPSYRRIKLNGAGCGDLCNKPACTTWVRMRVRLKIFKVSQMSDSIPLNSVTALKLMCQAIKKYEADLLQEYAGYFSAAREALEREQKIRSGPNQIKIQFQHAYGGKPGLNLI